MPLLWVVVGVALMLVLMLVVKLDAFFALILTSFVVALLNGMDLLGALQSILKGIGNTMGGVALMLVFGAMLGRLLDESGAAQAIATRFIDITGRKHIQYAMATTGLLVGIAMHYNAGFLVLIPLVYTVALTTGLPLVYVGLPLAAALSVTHGFTPPHPAPTFLTLLYHADVNQTLLVGLIAALPAAFLGGIVFSRFLRIRDLTPPEGLARGVAMERDALPGFGISLVTALVPVILMLANAIIDISLGTAGIDPTKPEYGAQLAAAVPQRTLQLLVTGFKFFGNPNIALMIAVLVAVYVLGVRRGRSMDSLMRSVQGGVATIAGILLIIAAGGAFSQVLRDGGVSRTTSRVRRRRSTSTRSFSRSARRARSLRASIGSATVAGNDGGRRAGADGRGERRAARS